MRRVELVRLGNAAPMGQQAYEVQLTAALRRNMAQDWTLTTRGVSSLRARCAASDSCRVPLRATWHAPFGLASVVGSVAYGRADVVHRLDLRCPPSRSREVLTIHDLPPLRFTDEGGLPAWAGKSARSAAVVICPSEFAAGEIRTLLGAKRVAVIPYGIDMSRAAAEPLSPTELGALSLRAPIVLHAAGATQRKNLRLLAEAWPEVLREHPSATLALCGPPSKRRTELFRGLHNVRYLGLRPPDFMARLIRSAAAVAVPSIYEGFGLPTLEAMVAGVAAVAVARGAIPEVAGDGALIVEPDRDAFAAGLIHVLDGGSGIERMRTRGLRRAAEFSWDRCASETLALYEATLS